MSEKKSPKSPKKAKPSQKKEASEKKQEVEEISEEGKITIGETTKACTPGKRKSKEEWGKEDLYKEAVKRGLSPRKGANRDTLCKLLTGKESPRPFRKAQAIAELEKRGISPGNWSLKYMQTILNLVKKMPAFTLHKDRKVLKGGIQKVLKQVHPDMGIKKDAVDLLAEMLRWLMFQLLDEAKIQEKKIQETLTEEEKKEEELEGNKGKITSRGVQAAVGKLLTTELARHSVSEGTKAVTKFTSGLVDDEKKIREYLEKKSPGTKLPEYGLANMVSMGVLKKILGKGTSISSIAGLQFSVSGVERLARNNNYKLTNGGTVYLAAVLEYIGAEILELSGNQARDQKRVRVQVINILLAVYSDEELTKTFADFLSQ